MFYYPNVILAFFIIEKEKCGHMEFIIFWL